MRGSRPLRSALAAAAAAAVLSWLGPAHAEERVDGSTAVQLGHDGLALYQRGEWQRAFSRFEEANAVMSSPVFLLYMARCRRNLSQLREAVALLEQLLTQDIQSDAPPAWSNALHDAKAELEALRRRVPTLRVAGKHLRTASIDGQPIQPDLAVALNPGNHIVSGSSLDGHFDIKTLRLDEGEQDVVVTLSFEPHPPAQRPPGVLSPEKRPRPDRAYRNAAWITAGAALTAALVGVVTGLDAKARVDSLRERCGDAPCPKELQDDADRARLLANVSTAAFGIAGANAVFSVTFVLLPQPAPASPDRR